MTHILIFLFFLFFPVVIERTVLTPQIDKNLRFLDSFVASARQAGAKPYRPPEHIVRAYRLSLYVTKCNALNYLTLTLY